MKTRAIYKMNDKKIKKLYFQQCRNVHQTEQCSSYFVTAFLDLSLREIESKDKLRHATQLSVLIHNSGIIKVGIRESHGEIPRRIFAVLPTEPVFSPSNVESKTSRMWRAYRRVYYVVKHWEDRLIRELEALTIASRAQWTQITRNHVSRRRFLRQSGYIYGIYIYTIPQTIVLHFESQIASFRLLFSEGFCCTTISLSGISFIDIIIINCPSIIKLDIEPLN